MVGSTEHTNNRGLFGSQTTAELKSTLFSRMSNSKKKENAAAINDTTRANRLNNNESAPSLNQGGPSSAAIGGNLTNIASP